MKARCAVCGMARASGIHLDDHEFVSDRTGGFGKPKVDRGWLDVKAEHLKAHPDCEVYGLPGDCSPGKPDVHHIQPRSAGGAPLGDHGELVTACRAHHSYIEEHRAEARALGLLERRKSRFERSA